MVRVAVAGDMGKLVALERAVETAPHWSEKIWEGTLRGGRGVFVMEFDGALLGFVVGLEVAGVVELESIVVSAGARRGGVGRELMGALEDWAKERGARSLELEVRASNAGAVTFYAALGFREQGRRPRYYSDPVEDAVLMTREV